MQTSDSSSGPPNPWLFGTGEDPVGVPTVLVIEDDREIRELLATVLDLAGFAAVTCDSAEAGLHALREQTFDLILTDYALPYRTGLWLLEAAEAEGLIDGTPVLIVTAHPTVPGARGYEIVQKPFDVDVLVDRVRKRMESRQPRRPRPYVRPAAPGDGDRGGASGCPEPIELILYVSSKSPRSAAAVKNITKVLARFRSDRVKLTVRDLSADPASGAEDSVAFTPTLVRRAPGPRTFIVGHLANPDLLLELLADCEIDEQ